MSNLAPTVLLVDDEPAIVDTLAEYLSSHGFHVITASNGVEALLQVTRHVPKAVILDLCMPRLGGLGALDRIRRLESSIAIILISGVEGAIETVREAGVNVAGALVKPFDPAQLVGTLIEAGVFPMKTPRGGPPRDLHAEGHPSFHGRALVVDDDTEVREVLGDYLKQKGFEVLRAADGEEALRRLQEFRPQVVLLDIAMPGLSGVETLRRIKALPLETFVVMVSGQEDMEEARRTLALGAADYVQKPVDFAYLGHVLETHQLMAGIVP